MTDTGGDAGQTETTGNEKMLGGDKKGKMQVTDIRSPKDLLVWFSHDMTSRWPILLFLGVFILSFVFLIIAFIEYKTVYAPAGIAGLVICLFGAHHFKTLMALREQVGEYEKLNVEFRKENVAMQKELSNLRDAQVALAGQEERLKDVNKHNKENLEKFQTIEKNLERMGSSNLEGMGNVLQTMHSLDDRLKKQMSQSRRSLYLRVFDEMEFKDDDAGMTEEEYKEFLKCLPVDHRKRLEDQYTFEEMAGDDKIIQIEEFSAVLDKMAAAEMTGKSIKDNSL